MGINDLLVTPVHVIIILLLAYWIRNKYFKDNPAYKYIMPGMMVKVVAAISTGIIYFYYYGAGDTIIYYGRCKMVSEEMARNFFSGLKVIFANPHRYYPDIAWLLEGLRAIDTSAFMVVRWGAPLAFLTFNTYSAIAVWFSFIAFTGCLAMLKVFTDLYPRMAKEMAIAILFIPSVCFWGSGLFKDTLSLAFLGWLTYGSYMLLIKRKNMILAAIISIVATYLLLITKAYIAMSFVPAIFLWTFMTYRSKIRNKPLRTIITPVVLGIGLIIGFFMIQTLGSQTENWTVDQLQKRAQDMQWWHTAVVEIYGQEGGGSFYSLGETEFTLTGIISKIPAALNVTFFRPYLWEANNPVMFMAAIESLAFFIITLRVMLKARFRIFSLIYDNPIIFFTLTFALVFGFGVGFTSYNFGALVRYKIPCLPFYIISLYLIYHYAIESDKVTDVKKESTGAKEILIKGTIPSIPYQPVERF